MKIFAFAAAFASASAKTYFTEDFNSGDLTEWVVPEREGLGKFQLSAGQFYDDEENLGLQTSEDAKFYGIATKFAEPFDNTDDTLVIQLSVKHEQALDCGGGYVKIYGPDADLESLDGDSPYNIMFGPDICGSKKIVHVIFSNKGENHLIKKTIRPPTDRISHAYTLIVKADNTYKVLVDNVEEETGSLTDDWDMLLPKMIKDPTVSKPSDWVEERKIVDPEDVKPADYDDIPATIPDPEAKQPEDWDEDMDGEWEVPMIPNSDYQGEWTARRIDNPDYKGPWEHPLVDNPEFKDDPTLYAFNSGSIGIDVWQVTSGTIFDDILVTSDVAEASEAAKMIIERGKAEAAAKEVADEKKRIETEEMKQRDSEFIDEEEDDEEDDEDHDEL